MSSFYIKARLRAIGRMDIVRTYRCKTVRRDDVRRGGAAYNGGSSIKEHKMKTTSPIFPVFGTIARLLGAAVAMFIAFMLSAMVSGADAAQLTPEEATLSGQMVLLVSFINALVLSYLALRSRWHGWKLVGALFVTQYGIETFMSQVETVVFNQTLQLTVEQVVTVFVSGLLRALIFAPLAVWILGKMRPAKSADVPSTHRLAFSSLEWVKRLSLLAGLYVVVYFIFGYFVAWQSAELRQFYSGSSEILPFFTHMVGVLRDDPMLALIQFVRGYLWVLVVLPLVFMFKGGKLETTFALALSLSVLLSSLILFPNPYMPEPIRMAHFYELMSSMIAFGGLVGWVLLAEKS